MQLGFELMLMGMGTVFAFLILLVFSMNIMSKIVIVMEHNETNTDEVDKIPDNKLLAIISAAIHQHRQRD